MQPCDLSFKSGRWNCVWCCLFDGRRMVVCKNDGNTEEAARWLDNKVAGVISYVQRWNDLSLKTQNYSVIYLFIGEKKCIMWWHKILIICPRIHTSRRINQSHKTNSIDWLSHYIKHSFSSVWLHIFSQESTRRALAVPTDFTLMWYTLSPSCFSVKWTY